MEPVPDRLALFLLESPDEAVAEALTATLRRLGFAVRATDHESDLSVVLDYPNATFSIFMITGSAEDAAVPRLPPDDGQRVPHPGAYAVLMRGVPPRDAPEGVGSITLDSNGEWLVTLTRWLAEMGWTTPTAGSAASSPRDTRTRR